ncbi:MAG: sulfite exporter TauE/SafE family protein, partial [Candidatus Eremiobacteraeota bacterium]|nr:sulfite exporter TauE/SafE family protein [Candidatus Eremiobacteraeota bacterium]
MTPQAVALIGAAAFVASGVNAGAGGGSFISFPALLAIGIAPINANATNNTAMWLGGVASASAFRRELGTPPRTLLPMFVVSIAGSVAGALLLLRTSNGFFTQLIPVLLLIATVLFIWGPALTRASQRTRFGSSLDIESPLGLAAQFGISVYGGFFGAAMGILMLALFGLLGITDLRRANAFKVLLSVAVNGVAVIPFVIARAIAWDAAFVAGACAVAGGYLGAHLVKRLPGDVVRVLVT